MVILNSNETENPLSKVWQYFLRQFNFALDIGKILLPFGIIAFDNLHYLDNIKEATWPEPIKSFVVYSAIAILFTAPVKVINRISQIGLDAYKLEEAQKAQEQEVEKERAELQKIDDDYYSQDKIITAGVIRSFKMALTLLPYPLLVYTINWFFKNEGYGSNYLMSISFMYVLMAMFNYVWGIVSKDLVIRSPNR